MPVFDLFPSKFDTIDKPTEEKIPKYIKRTKEEKGKAYRRNGLYYISQIFEEMPIPKDIMIYQQLLNKMFANQVIRIFDNDIEYCLWCKSNIDTDIEKTELYIIKKHMELLKRSIRMFKHHEMTDIYFFFGPNIEERNKFKDLLNEKMKKIYDRLNLDIKNLNEQIKNTQDILRNSPILVMNEELWKTYFNNTCEFIEEIKTSYLKNI